MVENLILFPSLPKMSKSFSTLPVAARSPGSKSGGHTSSWGSLRDSAFRTWPSSCIAARPQFGGSAVATKTPAWKACSPRRRGWADRRRFPPLQRAQIVELACLEPIARELHVTHWTSGDLARQAVADGVVSAISPATVRRILQHVDLQPHRTRYWKTSHLDAQFKERTEKVLWCYANAERLAGQGIWVVCTDEMPNLQLLERHPIRRAIPGYIERQEFEYIRHGTVTVLVFLVVHTGRMEAVCLESKSAKNYVQQLRHFRRRHRHLRGMFLIQDGDPTHTAAATEEYFTQCEGWWRPRLTPVHASWLDQAELLNDAFSYHYLKRGSWESRQQFIDHINASWPEYNRLYAHPFEWTWTNHQMRKWFAEHAESIPFRTYEQRH